MNYNNYPASPYFEITHNTTFITKSKVYSYKISQFKKGFFRNFAFIDSSHIYDIR